MEGSNLWDNDINNCLKNNTICLWQDHKMNPFPPKRQDHNNDIQSLRDKPESGCEQNMRDVCNSRQNTVLKPEV